MEDLDIFCDLPDLSLEEVLASVDPLNEYDNLDSIAHFDISLDFFHDKETVEKQVQIRTHKGSGTRVVTLEMLRAVGHLPQQQAADALKVGNTRFKTATRELGMNAWPYRKIKSVRNLITVVDKNRRYFGGEAEEIIQRLNALELAIFMSPTLPLNDEFKKFRQAAYKLTHKGKKRVSENENNSAEDDTEAKKKAKIQQVDRLITYL